LATTFMFVPSGSSPAVKRVDRKIEAFAGG